MKSMMRSRRGSLSRLAVVVVAGAAVTALVTTIAAYSNTPLGPVSDVAAEPSAAVVKSPQGNAVVGANDDAIDRSAKALLEKGRAIFRYDTFGDEKWWTDTIQLHKTIAGDQHGGIGDGVSPVTALAVGLKVDIDAVPSDLQQHIRLGKVNLGDPAVTLALLNLDAIVGVKATLSDDGNSIKKLGVTCALCHSTVDDSFAPGIGHRRDGWPNRDLNVGLIVSLAANLQPIADLLQTDVPTVKTVLNSWGPGRYDAWLDKDGKAFRPDGGQAGTLIPPAYGLAGVNLHTWTGSGSVPYWNAYVAATQMHGTEVTFFDPRLSDPVQYPVAARSGSWDTRGSDPANASAKLDALHYYQLSIPAPTPPAGSFDAAAAARGKFLFVGKAQCAACHVPPSFTEPGYAIHRPEEVGVDSFQADRSPTRGYRTSPLAGLWAHQKGGFYHDGRFATIGDVIDHYSRLFGLTLSDAEKQDLIQFLLSI